MKAEKETKKAGARRHDHPVKSEGGGCLLVAPSRHGGILHSIYSLFGVILHTHTHTKSKYVDCMETIFEIYVTADSNTQKALLSIKVEL